MRWFLYNVLFAIGYTLMLPKFFLRMRKRGGYRADFGQRLGRFSPEVAARLAEKPRVWIHAVSVGEANLAGAVLRELRRVAPGESFILSTTSSTGHAVCEKLVGPDDVLVYLPIDFPRIVRRSLKGINAKALVLTESEFWPNLIRACRRRGLPVLLVNGRVSDRSAPRYRRLRCFFGEVFDCFAAMLVQSELDRRRLLDAGAPADRVQVAGSVKFDVAPPAEAALETARQTLTAAGVALGADRILMGGSTWPGEELALAQAWAAARQAAPDLRLVLVPRHQERGDAVERELAAAGFRCLRRSRMKAGREMQAPGPDAILVVDTTGELFALYALADLVFVGKTLEPNVGGQNMIEPASFGKAVLCGPHTENFLAVMDIFRAGDAIREVADAAALRLAVGELAADAVQRDALGVRARRVVEARRGALARTAQVIVSHLR